MSLADERTIDRKWTAIWTGAAAIVLVAVALPDTDGRLTALLAIGLLQGVTLYMATFGFASAYRRLLTERRTDGVIAQFLMVGITTILFAPVLSTGSFFGQPVTGAYAPLSVQVAIGAALFGMGMQLAGGCGSGTLFTIGGGSARMVLVLVFFCAGSFAASLQMEFWHRLPSMGTIVLGQQIGWGAALALQVAVLIVLVAVLARWAPSKPWRFDFASASFVRGPWPLALGALALALLNFATLAVAGHPWSITWAFTLWGAKTVSFFGWDLSTEPFWSAGFPRTALEMPLLADTTTIMDFGIVLGAFVAAGVSGRFAPRLGISTRSAATAILGGVTMGYGARIAFGCNIGAFFSGAASTSLHGWLWFVSALFGSVLGLRLYQLIERRAA